MKKQSKIFMLLIVLAMAITTAFALVACDNGGGDIPVPQRWTVTFNTHGGSTVTSQTVDDGTTATRPVADPTRAGYDFVDWFTAQTGGQVFNFATSIIANTTIHAQWIREDITPDPTAPSVPLNFVATAGNGQVVLSWTTPANNGGSAITLYQVQVGSGAWQTAASPHTATGLTNGTHYTFRVRAVNAIGNSAYATQTATPTVPVLQTPSYTIPSAFTDVVIGTQLSTLTLPARWSWVNDNQAVGAVGTRTFEAEYTPADSNFYAVTRPVSVTVVQATPTYTTPSAFTDVAFGTQLSTLTIPARWSWVNGNQAVGVVGTRTFDAEYTPADSNFYSVTRPVSVSVVYVEVILSFETNGGNAISSITVNLNTEYGVLSTPTRAGFRFAGWWTQNGTTNNNWGSEVTTNTVVTNANNHTLFARWQLEFVQISTGNWHSTAIDAAGNIWTWGSGLSGQLGNGYSASQYRPRMITQVFDGATNNLIPAPVFTEISAGGGHSIAIDIAGNIWTWGNGSNGQLGHGNRVEQWRPRRITQVFVG